jgi:hypothetical protein
MITPVFHLEIREGTDYSVTFIYEDPVTTLPIDLTSYSATMQVRQGYDGYVNPDIDFTITPTLGGTAGTIDVFIPASTTKNLQWTNGVYDILLTFGEGSVTKFIDGFVVIIPTVTKL